MADATNYAIQWDAEGQRLYEAGVDRCVLFVKTGTGYGAGVPWNGLTSVSESPSGAEPTALWADNIKYLSLVSAEEFGATVEAYTYPDEFAECDGSATVVAGVYLGQQARKLFGFTYRSKLGNDVDGQEHGYKLHILYNCQASPSEKSYETINDSPDAITFSWEITTTPVNVAGYKPTACITIDSTKVAAAKLAQLETILYGTAAQGSVEAVQPRLPTPDEIVTLFRAA